ncbi:MAG: ATP phosphoribosyltransferase [Candidatus Komeilibacteria bacterium RIFCSPLOWO2_02_FULL_48_11]|uniref:ATP phosphoribosyltransferase n=1 Tax=Candidatus Komeilibacteria bacterium RIFCSPLOWO2_02_FULL_48_11 TaxID=1798553 RepID=A0A1G2BVF8_9BACT|nr:MAG: ATP phosphoribosyltransferase [Candidatus Komeilibacteria bacterium RIFCSPLOWO2_02_FULL_48_11]
MTYYSADPFSKEKGFLHIAKIKYGSFIKEDMMLKLALPNGSLEKNTTELFAAAGWSIEREDRSAMASTNCPFAESIFFTRPQAIPRVVSSGLCDVGICGYDCVAEARLSHELEERSEWPGIITFLPYSKKTWGCTRIVLCSRKNSSIQRIEDVSDGSKVYTEYPALTEQHFREHGIHVQCIRATGSVEGHVRIGEFEVGATVLEEGKTCDKNHLKVIGDLLTSATVLISRRERMDAFLEALRFGAHLLNAAAFLIEKEEN